MGSFLLTPPTDLNGAVRQLATSDKLPQNTKGGNSLQTFCLVISSV